MANEFSDMALVIPALNPTSAFTELVNNLRCQFTSVVVVNDGSETSYDKIFSQIENLGDNVHLISSRHNGGKGHALKKAFSFILDNIKGIKGVVTADCDGQHSAEDILKVGLSFFKKSNPSIVLGVREFDKDVPFRSKFGNLIIRSLFHLQTGNFVVDTQTGLRAIPTAFLNSCINIPSNNYEFEMDMLMISIKEKIPISSVKIKTIYLNGNKSSHFNPLLDSLKIVFVLIRYSMSSLVCSILDSALFMLFFFFNSNIWFCSFYARIISGSINFFLVRNYVFKTNNKIIFRFCFFWGYVLIITSISASLISYMTLKLGFNPLIAKISIETLLFFLNFLFQRFLIFGRFHKKNS
jgi:hypothetical protein